jgi:hypothetical protein
LAIKELLKNKKDTEGDNLVTLLADYGPGGVDFYGSLTCIGKAENCDKFFKLISDKAEEIK